MIFAVIYLWDEVFNWFKSHLIDYLKKMIEDKKIKIKKIFINYSYFKECIKRVYKEVDEEWTIKWEV